MKGYKAFESDLKCRNYQFSEGENHVFNGNVILCRSGFHFCTELQDVVKYYRKPTMRVFEIEANGTITDAKNDCSKRACSEIKLVKELTLTEVRDSITRSQYAFYWAGDIGVQEEMKTKITDSEYAYHWARAIGDQEHMKTKITDSEWAYMWAKYIGDKEYMLEKFPELEGKV